MKAYNLKESLIYDLLQERVKGRKYLWGYPAWIIIRGHRIMGNQPVRRLDYRNLVLFNFRMLYDLVFSSKSIYIGYYRTAIDDVLDCLKIENRYYISAKNGKLCDLTMHLLKASFTPISLIISFFLKSFNLRQVNEILFAKVLTHIISEKIIFFSGGIPFISAFNGAMFHEIQHGNIHNFYPILANIGCNRTKMIVYQDTRFLKRNIKILTSYIQLPSKKSNQLFSNELGFLSSPISEFNKLVINNFPAIQRVKPHPRDVMNYGHIEVYDDIFQMLGCRELVVLPSTVLYELIYFYDYKGDILVASTNDEDNLIDILKFYNIDIEMRSRFNFKKMV